MNSSDNRTSLALHLLQIWKIFDWVGKSDILPCLKNLSAAESEAPAVTDITLDVAAIVQMLKPGVS